MRKPVRRLVAGCFAVVVSLAAFGCENPTCKRMHECCEAIQGVEGVGRACGDIARQLDDADSCQSVLEAVRAMYDSRKDAPPPACTGESSKASSD